MRKKVSEHCQNCGTYIPKQQMYCDQCGAICMDKLPKNTGLRGVWVQFKRRMVLLWLTIGESFGYKPTVEFIDDEEQTKKRGCFKLIFLILPLYKINKKPRSTFDLTLVFLLWLYIAFTIC